MAKIEDQLFVDNLAAQKAEAERTISNLQLEEFPPKKVIESLAAKVERISKLITLARQMEITPQEIEEPDPKDVLLEQRHKRLFGE